jgi:hypothetical protein
MKSFFNLLLLSLPVICMAQIDTSSFGARINFSSGTGTSNPQFITSADFDGDGKKDVAVVNGSNNNVSVFRNIGAGSTINASTFAAKVDFTVGTSPIDIASTDLDLDGKPDIIVTNYSSNTVSVLRNTSTSGTLGFASKVDYTTGLNPSNLALLDVDGDGKTEVIVANFGTNTISIYKNQSVSGNIILAAKQDFAVSGTLAGASREMATGDVDGDGTDDIAVAYYNGYIGIFRNTSTPGTISLAPSVNLVGQNINAGLSLSDLDGDSKKDLVICNYGTSGLFVYKNTSISGTISFSPKVTFSTGVNPHINVVMDIDHDGKPDIVTGNRGSNTLSIFRNISSAGVINTSSFAAKVDFATSASPLGIVFSDINGDNKPEILVSNSAASTFSVFPNKTPLFTLRYYSKSSGDLNQLSTWGINTDGSGTSPLSFDSSNITYCVHNTTNPATGGYFKITGSNTALVLGDGVTPFNLLITDTLSCDSIYISSNITLSVTGHLATSRLGSSGTGAVQYLGTSSQYIAPGSYGNLFVNGSTKTLAGNVSVSNALGMFASISNPSFHFVLGTGANNTGVLNRASGTITGKFTRWFSATTNSGSSGLFPIGTATRYLPFQVEFTSSPSAGETVTAEFISSVPGNTGLPVFDVSNGFIFIDKAAEDGYWKVTSTINTGTFTAKATASSFAGVNAYSDLRMLKRAQNGSWALSGTALSNTGNNTSVVVGRSGMSVLNAEYGIGGDQSQNPLPVKLLSFTGTHNAKKDEINLAWQTGSELNNKGFEIERSIDHTSFKSIGYVKGKGMASDVSFYRYNDDITPLQKQAVKVIGYRLKQIDFDGHTSYSKTVYINIGQKPTYKFSIYPNPADNQLSVEGLEEPALVYDLLGNNVMTIERNGSVDISMLKNGIYFIQSRTNTQKLVKH